MRSVRPLDEKVKRDFLKKIKAVSADGYGYGNIEKCRNKIIKLHKNWDIPTKTRQN